MDGTGNVNTQKVIDYRKYYISLYNLKYSIQKVLSI